MAACSASSKAYLLNASAISGYPSLSAWRLIAKYIPTSVDSPMKLSLNPWATPILCSSAYVFISPETFSVSDTSTSFNSNCSFGAPHCGHFSGASSPKWIYPHTLQT